MLILNHTAIGAVIGKVSPDPLTAFVLGFLSHFLADIIPHGDAHQYQDYKRGKHVRVAVFWTVVDALASIVVAVLFFQSRDFFSNASVAMGIAGSVLPDAVVGFHELKPSAYTKWVHNLHFRNHNFIALRIRDWTFLSGATWQLALFYFIQHRV